MIVAFGFAVVLMLALSAALFVSGLIRLYGWLLDRRDSRVDSAYRADCLVACARAEVSGV